MVARPEGLLRDVVESCGPAGWWTKLTHLAPSIASHLEGTQVISLDDLLARGRPEPPAHIVGMAEPTENWVWFRSDPPAWRVVLEELVHVAFALPHEKRGTDPVISVAQLFSMAVERADAGLLSLLLDGYLPHYRTASIAEVERAAGMDLAEAYRVSGMQLLDEMREEGGIERERTEPAEFLWNCLEGLIYNDSIWEPVARKTLSALALARQ